MVVSFKKFLLNKSAPAPQCVGEPTPLPGTEGEGLHLSGNSCVHASPEKENAQLLPTGHMNRKLGETVADVPFVFPSENDSPRQRLHKAVLLSEERDLGIWINPDSTDAEAWLAVQVRDSPNLVLIQRFPLLNRQSDLNEPF